jgi:hypothetical protein
MTTRYLSEDNTERYRLGVDALHTLVVIDSETDSVYPFAVAGDILAGMVAASAVEALNSGMAQPDKLAGYSREWSDTITDASDYLREVPVEHRRGLMEAIVAEVDEPAEAAE